MEEIAKTFDDVGLTPRMLQGAADLYRFIGATPLADETPENYDRERKKAAAPKRSSQEVKPVGNFGDAEIPCIRSMSGRALGHGDHESEGEHEKQNAA